MSIDLLLQMFTGCGVKWLKKKSRELDHGLQGKGVFGG